MTFRAFCLCHELESRARFDACEQAILRRRFIADAESARESWFSRLWWQVTGLGLQVQRDIRDQVTEA